MLNFLVNLDRRIIFLLVAISVIIPYLFPFTLPLKPGELAKNLYDFIEALPPDSKVLLSFDYEPSTQTELDPMALALTRHLFKKNKSDCHSFSAGRSQQSPPHPGKGG